MRYAIRNSIILFVILALIGAGSWAYIHYTQDKEIVRWQQQHQHAQSELADINSLIDQYDPVREKLMNRNQEYLSHSKLLYPEDSQSIIYGFINAINNGRSYIDYDISYLNTVEFDGYGIVRTGLTGTGYFRNLYRFVTALEKSGPLNKITMLHIETIDEPDIIGKVKIQMQVESYFAKHSKDTDYQDRLWVASDIAQTYASSDKEQPLEISLKKGAILKQLKENGQWTNVKFGGLQGWVPTANLTNDAQQIDLDITRVSASRMYNPFYPLIHSIPKNKEGLVDVKKSKLIALSGNNIYLIDQTGNLVNLNIGDEVYLGWLKKIDQMKQTAHFTLNKGGVIEKVELKVDEPAKQN